LAIDTEKLLADALQRELTAAIERVRTSTRSIGDGNDGVAQIEAAREAIAYYDAVKAELDARRP
jgi:hypothetical protein